VSFDSISAFQTVDSQRIRCTEAERDGKRERGRGGREALVEGNEM